jgi:predicted TPR repeat methyltransferase
VGKDSDSGVPGKSSQVDGNVHPHLPDECRGLLRGHRRHIAEAVKRLVYPAYDRRVALGPAQGNSNHLELLAIMALEKRREEMRDHVLAQVGRHIRHANPAGARVRSRRRCCGYRVLAFRVAASAEQIEFRGVRKCQDGERIADGHTGSHRPGDTVGCLLILPPVAAVELRIKLSPQSILIIGGVAEQLPEGVGSFLIAPQREERMSSVAECRREVGPDCQGPIVARHGFIATLHGQEHVAAVGERLDEVRRNRQRPVVPVERLPSPLQRCQGVSTVVEGLREAGFELERAIDAAQRFSRSPELHEGTPTVAERFGVVRVELEGALEAGERLLWTLQFQQRRAQVGVGDGLIGIGADRSFEQFGGAASPSALQGDEARKIQRGGVLRVCFEDLRVQGFGFLDAALLVQKDGALELVGDDRGGGLHGRNITQVLPGSGFIVSQSCRACIEGLMATLAQPTFDAVLKFYGQGMLDEARRACGALLGREPLHVGALRVGAEIAKKLGNWAEAGELLERAARAAPRDEAIHGELGLILLVLQRPREAVSALSRAVELSPTAVVACNNLAVALLKAGRLDEAEAACRRALALDPSRMATYNTMAECLRYQGRMLEARRCLESTLERAPGTVSSLIALADLLIDSGEFQAAAAKYREAISRTPSPAPLYGRLGIALKESGDPAGALEAFRMAVAAESQSPEPHYLLAQALLELGRPSEAIGIVREAIRLRPDMAVAHVLHGAAVAALGDLEGAVAKVRAGPDADKSTGECLTLLADNLKALGQPRQALECLQRRLEKEPEHVTTRHTVAALSGLNPEHAPPGYVSELFDRYAQGFNGSLLRGLGYSVPREVAQGLREVHSLSPPWDILDLGCGTGLVGRELAAHARSLVGVDLSRKMIDCCKPLGIYTRLICGDLLETLERAPPDSLDVITAADVFIYVGKLDAVIAAARRVLRPGGLLGFSAEALEETPGASGVSSGYWLHTRERYAHRADYLDELARRNGFVSKLSRKIQIRFEQRQSVMGWLMVWAATR